MHQVICFGEVLWDLLPHGRFLGGAPLNVAYHLARLGCTPQLISAVGADALGEASLAAIAKSGLHTDWISRHPHLPTGTVEVALDASGQATYRIHEPVAWDEIELLPKLPTPANAIVFGSLGLRSTTNRATLRAWLRATPALRVCDLNLRPPHDRLDGLEEFIRGVDLLKLNVDEARRLMPTSLTSASIATHAAQLAATYECATVCITLGAEGALLRHKERIYHAPAPTTSVRDTIGSGDAFTAALLAGILQTNTRPDWTALLRRACALGAFVAGCDGAQPHYEADKVLGAG
jgi:fructokinase